MKQLKKCPFCGGEATFSNGMDNTSARIRCTKCRCKMEVFGESAFERAREEWNTRKPMERILERLENNSEWTEPTYDIDGYCNDDSYDVVMLDTAIEIVKEELS